jgi:hypothetical protein
VELVASRDGRRFIGWFAQTLARTRRVDGKVAAAIFAASFGLPPPGPRDTRQGRERLRRGSTRAKSRNSGGSPLVRIDVWRPDCPIKKAA